MADKTSTSGSFEVPAKQLAIPKHLSPAAAATLTPPGPAANYPDQQDTQAWKNYIAAMNGFLMQMMTSGPSITDVSMDKRVIEGADVYVCVPKTLLGADRGVILMIHGGALVCGEGEFSGLAGQRHARDLQKIVWSVDYRMPPDHPYPAGLDDCVNVYKALLKERKPSEIIISGNSAGGNLAAATILRARDEGLPLPAAAILETPEIDLTESGDTFQTNNDVDSLIRPFMAVNKLYANGQDLAHPYLSPLFGDFTKGFPPTILHCGTRDLFLSNTVRFHRALRKAGIEAHLHVQEAAGHIGFPGSPEGEEILKELRAFVKEKLQQTSSASTRL